jgi:hypothetical protein
MSSSSFGSGMNMGGMSYYNPNYSNFNTGESSQSSLGTGQGQNTKKIPNPSNYKIVKCKNFEKGKLDT